MPVNRKEMKRKIKRRKLYKNILKDLEARKKVELETLGYFTDDRKIGYYENQLRRTY